MESGTGFGSILHLGLLGAAVSWLVLALSGRLNAADGMVGLLGALLLVLLASYYDPESGTRGVGQPVARWWYLYASVLGYLGLRAAQRRDRRRRPGAPSSREGDT
jgi:hypothetical protein